jgi:peptidoglycan hydrolase-like protein with peptidoglycan-binding domain
MAFQYKHGFAKSGVVGSRTLNALRLRAGWPAGWEAGPVGRGSGYASPDGSIRVSQAQRALNSFGYDAGPVDGLFGPRTVAATLRFQRSHALPANGVIGRDTARVLLIRPPAARPPARVPAAVSPPPSARPEETPTLPTVPLLIALALLGVLVATVSYRATGRRLREER